MKNIMNFKQFEAINLNIKVGDVLLGGRFKNKQVKVKKIGKDGNGQVTINGKPLLKFRIWNNLPQTMKNKFQLKDDKKNEGFFFKDKPDEEQGKEIYNYLLEHPEEPITIIDETWHDREGLAYVWTMISFVMRKGDRKNVDADPYGEEIWDDDILVEILNTNTAFIFHYNIIIDKKKLKCSRSIARKIFKLCKNMKKEEYRKERLRDMPVGGYPRQRGTDDTGPR